MRAAHGDLVDRERARRGRTPPAGRPRSGSGRRVAPSAPALPARGPVEPGLVEVAKLVLYWPSEGTSAAAAGD